MEHAPVRIHKRNLKARLETLKTREKIPVDELQELEEFLRKGQLGQINKKKPFTEARCVKYCDMLRLPLEYFGKNLSTLTLADMERFELDFSKDNMRNKLTGKPFKHNTKVEIRKLLRIYLRYRFKFDPKRLSELTDWLDVTYKPRTPEYLSELEVIKVFNACKNDRDRFIVAVLFDAGARIEEFMNLYYEDFEPPTPENPFYMLDLKEEYSKTLGRKVGLFWKYSTQAVRDYLTLISPEDRDKPLMNVTYNNILEVLHKLGYSTIKKRIHPHLFRHSSATYYASRLNRQELCVRYGWKFSSNMPDTYIARSGISQASLSQLFKDKHNTAEEENSQLRKELGEMKKYMKKLMEKTDKQDRMLQNILPQSVFRPKKEFPG